MEPDGERELEDLFASYVDRLNAGEALDPEKVLEENPLRGAEILDHLADYIAAARPDDADAASALGTLGDYTLRRRIGRGGMGVVYEAWEGSMDRRVALKVLPSAVAADARAVARFIREAQVAGKLSHPNVVSVYAMGVKEQTPYFAMEYVEGETLAQIVGRMKSAAADAPTAFGESREELGFYPALAKALADVADGLQHAHSRGVVHRDIKPSNLILDREGKLRILDFGLARLEGQESLSATGDFVGTPLYMSPEQARRRKVSIDHRTDVYSLGATLYEVLTLEPPFRGKDHEDTLSQIIQRDPRPPRQMNPRVPRDLETIVLKCLRKDPGDRYGTAEALGQDLRRFVRGDPIEARPQARWEKAARRTWRARWPILWGLAAASFLLIAALWLQDRVAGRRREADAAYRSAVLGAAWDLELGKLADAGPAYGPAIAELSEPHAPLLARERPLQPLEAAAGTLRRALALRPGSPEAAYHLGRALLLLERTEEALAAVDGALAGSPAFVPALALRGDILREMDDLPGAARADEAARRAADRDWPRAWLEAHDATAGCRWSEAADAFGRLLDAIAAAGDPYLGASIELRMAAAVAFAEGGDWNRAIEGFAGAQSLWPEALVPGLCLGKVYYRRGDRAAAESKFDEVHRRARGGPKSADAAALGIWGIYSRLGDQETKLAWARKIQDGPLRSWAECVPLFFLGRISEARTAAKTASETYPGDPYIWAVRAMIHSNLSEAEDARRCAQRAMDAGMRESRSNDWYTALLIFLGRLEEAEAVLLRMRDRDPDWPETHTQLASLDERRGRLAEAEEHFREALRLSPGRSSCLRNLGTILERQGKLEAAEEEYERAIARMPCNAQNLETLGELQVRMGKGAEAFRNLAKSIACDPEFIDPCRDLIALHLRVPDLEGTAPDWDGLVEALEPRGSPDGADPLLLGVLGLGLLHGQSRRDPERARSRIEAAVERSGRNDPAILAILAEALAQAGERTGAVMVIEEALKLPGADPVLERPLAILRGAILPDLASMASIEAALRDRDPGRDPELLEGFRSIATGEDAPARIWFLEGRVLQRAGKPAEAAERFAGLRASGDARPAVLRRLVESLRDAGLPAEAEKVLRDRLRDEVRDDSTADADRDLWELWPSLVLDALRQTPAEARASIPSTDGLGGDIAWLLDRLAAGDSIRIRSGGGECRDSRGRVWGPDRFFLGGNPTDDMPAAVEGTDDGALYLRERWFPAGSRAGYRIPLPRGSYRALLHFRERWFQEPGRRRFDVRVETMELPGYEPPVGKADVREFQVRVEDGVLEIEFRHEIDNPMISAIEVLRVDG